MCVCLCVCPPPRLLITNGMMWCNILTLCDWLAKFYRCYMATVVSVVDGHGLGVNMNDGN